jgi:hypothetical protein
MFMRRHLMRCIVGNPKQNMAGQRWNGNEMCLDYCFVSEARGTIDKSEGVKCFSAHYSCQTI